MAELLYSIAVGIALLAVVLTVFRLAIGPTTADRVVALDAMTIVSVSIIAVVALFADRVIYLDVALVYALVSFLGVVAVARYLERGL